MTRSASERALEQFDQARTAHDETWKIDFGPGITEDLERLAAWAESAEDPVRDFVGGRLDLPEVHALGDRVAAQVDQGPGFAWLRGLPEAPGPLISLVFLAIGLELGETIDVYGRLYEVVDHGESYREKAIPVSQTRESTGMHTDSSNKPVWPRVVALACLRPSPMGGESRLSSAVRAHEVLRSCSPKLLEQLYGDFFRDVVTPGSDRDPQAVRKNVFPIFHDDQSVTLRYMRYWIEKGHERAEVPLTQLQREALDALDEALEDPEHLMTFNMQAGDMLFLDNTRIAHDRTGYVDQGEQPRHLQRMWIDRQRADQPGEPG